MAIGFSDVDAAYAAGLLDGEGCISITKVKGKSCIRGYSHQLNVRFAMTDKGPIDFIAETFAGTKPETPRLLPSGRILYRVAMNGPAAIEFLRRVHPFVHGKREQVEVALLYPVRPKGNRKIADGDHALREDAAQKLTTLKAVGHN